MQKNSQELSKFELHLNDMIIKVENCQKDKNLSSCSICEHYLNCELRTDYVKAVYSSMSKGAAGGFEF